MPNPPVTSAAKCARRNHCLSDIKVKKYSHTWVIKDFSFSLEDKTELHSATFPAESEDDMKWRIIVKPNGGDHNSKEYVSVYLELLFSEEAVLRAKFKFSILNANWEQTRYTVKAPRVSFVEANTWAILKFIRLDELLDNAEELLPDDTFTLYCEVLVFAVVDTFSARSSINIPDSQLSTDLSRLFGSEDFSDVAINANGVSYCAHRNILAVRCPELVSFVSSQQDTRDDCLVEVKDVNPDVLQEMLQFIYTGEASDISDVAKELFIVARRFNLERLVSLCEQTLLSKLSVQTAAQTLVFAERHRVSRLKKCAIGFIRAHFEGVTVTSGWKEMLIEAPQLVREVCQALAGQKIAPGVIAPTCSEGPK
ncbi:hypothetical protein HPB48_006480 [Haemaphysalis longicornis]|uniref:Speckle-type POZ protein n=1 Tax=Haemaphysalis longicornis TaxID=44386 RepID=A0A9J6FAR0_HAELO|nr:hypothetical protein HPB48_006480 [Haemaphysalis longicornis]